MYPPEEPMILHLEHPQGTPAGQPVTVGVPLPRGRLTDTTPATLLDSRGQRVPLQTGALAHWPDRSVRWLLLDFLTGALPPGRSSWQLHLESATAPVMPPDIPRDIAPAIPVDSPRDLPRAIPPATGLSAATSAAPDPGASIVQVRTQNRLLEVDTGAATFFLDRTRLHPLTQVKRDGRELLADHARIALTDAQGHIGIPHVEKLEIESSGPIRATICLRGRFDGSVPCQFVARLDFFAGSSLTRLRFTLHNPNRARHAGGQWDLGDPGSMLFRDLSLELAFKSEVPPRLSWRTGPGESIEHVDAAMLELYQDSSGGEHWNSHNHVNREGRVPVTFPGYRLRAHDGKQAGRHSSDVRRAGRRASPVIRLGGPEGAITASIPEFWQQFPKAIEVEDRRLSLRLFPRQFGDLHELQGGEQKTHTVWLAFDAGETVAGRGKEASDLPLEWTHHPVVARPDPAWVAATGVLFTTLPVTTLPVTTLPAPTGPDADGSAGPHASPTPLEPLLLEMLEGPRRYVARREIIDEYGWRNFGEIYADHEGAHYKGPPPVVSHYNNQYDFLNGLIVDYLRSGDVRWLELLDPLARHVIDIDVYRTNRDKAAYNGGLFWHTDHYLDAATCSHRTFSTANARGRKGYGGGPGAQHNATTGLMHYYYLTGDKQARDTVLILADWVVAMEDGSRNILGMLVDDPTGWATSTFNYHGPGRGAGYSITALLDAWLLTGRPDYLTLAETLIRRAVHPSDDVGAQDLLNAELRWSYTIFLTTLGRYLHLKAEAGQIDFMYAWAQTSLVRYASWMLEHEAPYFDRIETLEYPTETWAGQEMRKANVLRLAAAHVDEPLRGALLKRGLELADRAWRDLMGFESRTVARSMAIFMVDGPRDDYFRRHDLQPAPRAGQIWDFGVPQTFAGQRAQVVAKLKSGPGLARAVGRLVDFQRWRKLWEQEASIKP